MEPLAEDKGIEFALRIDTNAAIVGDRELILEALVNLVDNAIKYTPTGGVCRMILSTCLSGVSLRVEDNGPGIPEAERSAVTRRFYKGSTHRHSDGNGLGLALVAAVANLHDFEFVVGDNGPGCIMELTAHV